MGVWSGITHTAGSLVKNTIKIGIGYAVGEAVENMVNDSDDPAKSGAAGLLGVASIYAIPAVGSKFVNFMKEHTKSVNDPEVADTKTSYWKAIGKSVAVLAGGTFAAWQAGKWYKEYKDANDNVYNPGENEYLQLGTSVNTQANTSETQMPVEPQQTEVTEPVNRTGDELMENIQTEPEADGSELAGP